MNEELEKERPPILTWPLMAYAGLFFMVWILLNVIIGE